jgi:hypothetical protein
MIVADFPVNPGSEGTPAPLTGASAPPFQPVAPPAFTPVDAPSQTFAATSQPAAPPMKKGGSSALKIILIILAIFAFLVVMVLAVIGYGVYKVRQAIHVNKDTGAITSSIPGLAMNSDPGMKFTPAELGTDIYPSAEPTKSGNMRMNIAGSSVVTATFLTSDSKEKVVDFYKSKLGSDATSMDFGGSAILSEKKSDQDQVTITVSSQDNQSEAKTQIHIQHTTVKK